MKYSFSNKEIVFYKDINHRHADLLNAIQVHTGVSIDQAIRMFEESRFYGGESTISKAVRDSTRSIHKEIASEIVKYLRHYGVTNRGPKSSKIYITGKGGWNQFLKHSA